MNKQTLYIILIILLFNFLLLNIFKLQKGIKDIRCKTDKLKNMKINNNNNNNPKGFIEPNSFEKISKTDNNNGFGFSNVYQIMNDIAELVPIDINKIYPSLVKFESKVNQVKHI